MTDNILSRDEVILRRIGDLDPATTINDTDELSISQGGAVRKTNLGDIFASVAEEAVEDVEELRTEILTALGDYVNVSTDQDIAGTKTFTVGPRIGSASTQQILYGVADTANDYLRWGFGKNSAAEAGSNAGSDFVLNSYSDAGTYLGTPLKVKRSSGLVDLSGALNLAGSLSVGGVATLATLAVTGSLSAGPSTLSLATITGNATVGGTLGVTGISTFTGQINSNRINAVFTGASSGQHSISAICQATTGDNISGINVSSSNTKFSSAQITGVEEGHGTLKISHVKPTASDVNAAALSIDLKGTGTAAKGIFITATEGGTTGNLLDIRNNALGRLRLTSGGNLILAEDFEAADGRLTIRLVNDTESGVSVSANSTGGSNLFELRRSSDNAVRTRFDSQCQFVTQQNAYFTGSGLQIGSTSTNFGGGSLGIIGINNAGTVPTSNPTNAVILYAQSGEFKTRSSGGVIATMGDALKIQGAAVQSATPTDGQTLVYVADNSRYEPQSVTGLTGVAQTIDGVKTFASSPVVPDVTVGTKDDKAANTQFVQESLETAGWRLVEVYTTVGDEFQVNFIASDYTSLDIDAIRYRITNLSGGSGLTGRACVMRVNDLANDQAVDSWSSAGIFTDSETNSAAYSSFAGAWSKGPFAYASNTGINASLVEGNTQVMGLAGRLVGSSKEQRITRNTANTADTFQEVNWSMWSAPSIYATNKITQVAFISYVLTSGSGLGALANYAANIKFEFYIKVRNS
ncbi:hypothetical protein IQ273_28965 [Nodosilinea sp. LEGE 07298]|uniref:hypothetical protein n=1 Tax=Nodosilinea sp. LEGE 07298 TaxID=2777970 RepID=UPI00188016E6|nr:hypothetical protein [Nodosilinea sp. LEGE 07298]MBE9113412.1 hypothetical protein [Nodosilinea sp. LEGE 07298]